MFIPSIEASHFNGLHVQVARKIPITEELISFWVCRVEDAVIRYLNRRPAKASEGGGNT
jgi:hypothetical protein